MAQKNPSTEAAQKCLYDSGALDPDKKISTLENIEEKEVQWLNPSEIKYSQATISRFFRKIPNHASSSSGTYAEALKAAEPTPVDELLGRLRAGLVKVEDISPIRVVRHKDAWYTLDNRRLWVFRHYGKPIPVLVETPSKEFFRKLDLQGDGENVIFQSSQSVEEYKANLQLATEVLRLSLKDIQNDRLFANQVKKIPLQFPSMKKYLDSFIFPLLEETRADLKQSLEKVGDASCMQLRGLEEKDPKLQGALRKFCLQVENEANTLKPKDVVLLTTIAPTNVADLQRYGEHYTLALLHGECYADDTGTARTRSFKADVYGPVESPEYKELKKENRVWYLICLTSLATALRTWKALHWPLEARNITFPIIEEVLYAETQKEFAISEGGDVGGEYSFPALKSNYKLNGAQLKAISTTVSALVRNERPYVRLIQGPPGTGKTTMLVGMLSVFCSMKNRVLMCAPTNTAVAEVLMKFLKCLQSEPARIRIGDIVLVGNKEKLPVDALSHVFLPHRIKRLMVALDPFSGWRHKIMSMIDFLEHAEGMHEQYVACGSDKDKVNFLQFATEKITLLGKQLMDVVEIVCQDLPAKFLNSICILSAGDILSKIIHAMSKINSDEVARLCFRQSLSNEKDLFVNGSISHDLNELYTLLQRSQNFVNLQQAVVTDVWMEEEFVKQASVVFCTVSSSGRQIIQQSLPFDVGIIDEASQLVEAETTIIMGTNGIRQLVLVGDHHQLPATVVSQVAKDCGYGRSLFQRLQSLKHPINMLNMQYRMHPSICQFPNHQFYNGELENGSNVMKDNMFNSMLYGPYKFLDTIDGIELDNEGHSKKNPVEVEILRHILKSLSKECTSKKSGSLEVGIISPYSGQVELLESRLSAIKFDHLQVEVKSVDGFQGREKDVILVSTVRCNHAGNIGFLEDYRRLNVAITRARKCLYIVGNASTLHAKESVWKDLIDDAKQRDCFMDLGQNAAISRLIIRIKEEVNQLADLLNPHSVLFSSTIWKVLFSKDFKENLTGINSLHVKQNILYCILKLANGLWPQHKFQSPRSEFFPDIIKITLTTGSYIVWTVDVQRDSDAMQIIKVWNVVNQQGLDRAVRRLENLLFTYSHSYLNRCKPKNRWAYNAIEKPVLNNTNMLLFRLHKEPVVPLKWRKDDTFVWHKPLIGRKDCSLPKDLTAETTEGEQANVVESLLLMKFYCLSLGVASQLLTASDGSNIELPFVVTEQETCILKYPLSCFVVGRSGTGKTTVITMKLLQKEQEFRISTCGLSDKVSGSAEIPKSIYPTLRQAIITVSPKLCAAIKHHIARVRRSLIDADRNSSMDELEADTLMFDEEAENNLLSTIPNTFINIPDEAFPLIITFRKFLSMLDGSIKKPFLTLRNDGQEPSSALTNAIENCDSDFYDTKEVLIANVSEDDDEDEEEDEDENEDDDEVFNNPAGLEGSMEYVQGFSNSLPQCAETTQAREVNFDCFASFYWVHFNSTLTKKFDASLIYTEIMSCIKGSTESLDCLRGRLPREKYVSKAQERTSAFDECQRQDIYSLYMQYEKLKARNGDYDLCDYVWHLHEQLKDGGFLGNMLDFLYIDEVQDLSLSQICLFKYVSKNNEKGFMFAGDTAQTIAKGVSFRFEDIRSLFYREFLTLGIKCMKVKKLQESNMPLLHQLSQNFRTHRGIIELADSIMKLVLHFFPETVDRLHPEYSLISGEKPIIINTMQNHSSITSLFGRGGTIGGMACEFGAEQVILVRDDSCKQRIFEQLGKRGLVLTILECKGLEFQDVLLYNFFSDSNLSQKWRVLYHYLQIQNICHCNKQSFPKFDIRIHNCLCNELKQLYVAITRSKQRFLIYDENGEIQKPMLDYWTALGLVQVKELDESLISSFQSISTSKQWNDRGTQLFNDRQYDMAMLCFERAGDMYRKHWSEAAALQQTGERQLGIDLKDAILHLKKAIDIYISLDKFEMAAKCAIKIKDFKKAGFIYQSLLSPPKLEEAGNCFFEAKCLTEAAEAYGKAGNVQKCLSICEDGKLWEKGRAFIQLWQEQSADNQVSHEVQKLSRGKTESLENIKLGYLKNSALYYHEKKDVKSMMKYVHMFPGTSEKRKFLSRRDYYNELLQVEISSKNYREAAEVAEQMGNLKLAAEMIEKAGNYTEGALNILRHVRLEMLWGSGNKGWPLRARSDADLERAKCLAVGEPKLQNEIEVLKMSDVNLAQILGKWKISRQLNDNFVEIIVLHQALDESIRSWSPCTLISSDPLSVDNILDVQCCESMQRGESIQSLQLLILLWNTWYKKINFLIKVLARLQKKRSMSEEDEALLGPCFDYLGIRRALGPQNVGICKVEDSAAFWLQKIELHPLPNQGKRAELRTEQVLTLAKEFWASQLMSTGIQCVRVFEDNLKCMACIGDRCQLIVKVIDLYNELLDLEIPESSDTIDFKEKILSYRLRLYNHLFHQKESSTFNICALREDPRVVVHLEKMLERSMGLQGPQTYEEVGLLQILLPFVSRSWLAKARNTLVITTPSEQQASDLINWFQFHNDFPEASLHRSCDLFGSKVNTCMALEEVFFQYSAELQGFINPSAFIYLVERAFVVTYACISHAGNDMIIPTSIAIDHMTGKRHEILYSVMLQMHCNSSCKHWVKGLASLVRIGVYLLTRGNELIDWLNRSNLEQELSTIVFRLIRMLITVYMDDRNVQVHWDTYQGLNHIFMHRSPILEGLPSEFKKNIQRAFDKSSTEQQLRAIFAESMTLIGDPFIVLRKRGKPRMGKTRMQIIWVEMKNGSFSLLQLKTKKTRLQATPNSKSRDGRLGNITNEDKKERNYECTAEVGLLLSEKNMEATVQPWFIVIDDMKLSWFIGRRLRRELQLARGRLKASLQPWYIIIDDSKLPWFIGWRLKRKLQLIRERLQEDDSVRAARSTFSKMGCLDSQYIEKFLTEVCPLKAYFEEFLAEMNVAIQVSKIKGDALFDKMMDFQENSQQVLELLNSSHEGHRKFDVDWLESEVIIPAKEKLEEGKNAFGHMLDSKAGQEQCLQPILIEECEDEDPNVGKHTTGNPNKAGKSKGKKKKGTSKKKNRR